ncbi:MAG: hypothetical protein OEU78_09760, partial [Gammaproteobacteria bacterium]|nr:hypothetical protein [Gammaproteobacteria bacterium]
DVVNHGENGLVFSAGNAIELKDSIRSILDDESLYSRLVKNSHRSVIEKFDWQPVGKRYIEIIEQCINTPNT